MKWTFLSLKAFYAGKKGASGWTRLSAADKVEGEQLINVARDETWYAKQWSFCGRKQNLTLVAPYATGTVSGSKGGHVLTGDSTAWATHVYGVPIRGQMAYVGSKLYKIKDRISTTKLIIDSPLVAAIAAGTSYKIYFVEYPLRWDVGAIRDVIRGTDPLTGRPEQMMPVEGAEGTPELWHPAGQTEEDFETGTGTLTKDSRTVSSVAAITPADHHIGMALTPESVHDIYYIVDFSGTNFTLDRAYKGATLTATNIRLNPAGTPLIGFRDFPQSMDIVRLVYTKQPPKMRGDYDLSGLPNDVPLLRAIQVIITEWETVGERGYINEVLWRDRKWKDSLKLLELRSGQINQRFMTLHDLHTKQRRFRNSNPWNQPY